LKNIYLIKEYSTIIAIDIRTLKNKMYILLYMLQL
jgi:hypothetical protein